MPKYTVRVGEDFALKLSQLADCCDATAEKAIMAGADIVADEVRRRLEANLSDPAYLGNKEGIRVKNNGKKTSGSLLDSFGITPVQKDSDGNWNAKIGFDGYGPNGVPNQLKARAMESGSSKQKKRPFMEPAVKVAQNRAQDTMEKIIKEEFKKEMRR